MAANCSCTGHANCKKKNPKLFKVDITNSFSPSYTKQFCKDMIDLYESKGYNLDVIREVGKNNDS